MNEQTGRFGANGFQFVKRRSESEKATQRCDTAPVRERNVARQTERSNVRQRNTRALTVTVAARYQVALGNGQPRD